MRVASALLPMGGRATGVAGRNWMLIGDAAACVNPLNGGASTTRWRPGAWPSTARCRRSYTTRWRDVLNRPLRASFSGGAQAGRGAHGAAGGTRPGDGQDAVGGG